ncbi:MAG: phytanoyl-CoA dioxygenase family protein [Inquilinus sp.]|nr:phytanoyl-CoA dioxygenase family protein [Inquilinus sp.]
MSDRRLADADVAAFERDGYVFKRGLFDAGEVALMQRAIAEDAAIRENLVALLDAAGGSTELALWNHPGDDVFGAVARSERVVSAMQRLLGGEIYHYHSKLTMKAPKTGGAWNWHQDYGYWYQNGCLFPDLASAMIAIDPSTRENGCLQVVKGSHRLGRIEHLRVGGQTSADPERMDPILARLELLHCEMAPGDALFFHCNTLHASSPNTSDKPRNVLICCYNAASNDPYKEHHHPRYTKLTPLADDQVIRARIGRSDRDTAFYDPADDQTVTAGKKT